MKAGVHNTNLSENTVALAFQVRLCVDVCACLCVWDRLKMFTIKAIGRTIRLHVLFVIVLIDF